MGWVEDVQDPFYLEEDVEAKSDGRRDQVTPLTLEKPWESSMRYLLRLSKSEIKWMSLSSRAL